MPSLAIIALPENQRFLAHQRREFLLAVRGHGRFIHEAHRRLFIQVVLRDLGGMAGVW